MLITDVFYFMIHTVQSPQLYVYNLWWPEDGPVQGPKHVVSLSKDNIRQLCFNSKEPLFNRPSEVPRTVYHTREVVFARNERVWWDWGRVYLHVFFISARDGRKWWTSRLCRFTRGESASLPTAREKVVSEAVATLAVGEPLLLR
jgi:hypothetical protein